MAKMTPAGDGLGALQSARTSPVLMLAVLGTHLMTEVRDAHAALGLKPRQFEVLALLEARHELSQGDLATRMDMSASALVAVLNPLEEGGRIERRRAVNNRKHNTVAITSRGKTLLQAASETQHRLDTDLLSHLSPLQGDQLAALLGALRDGDLLRDPSCHSPHWMQQTA